MILRFFRDSPVKPANDGEESRRMTVVLFILKNLPNFAEKPELWDDPYFEAMIQEAEYANMSDAQQMAYLRSLMARWDYANTIDFAREEGREEVARRMLAEGFDAETIARLTGLTEEQIAALL